MAETIELPASRNVPGCCAHAERAEESRAPVASQRCLGVGGGIVAGGVEVRGSGVGGGGERAADNCQAAGEQGHSKLGQEFICSSKQDGML